jgi:hypothetical protein
MTYIRAETRLELASARTRRVDSTEEDTMSKLNWFDHRLGSYASVIFSVGIPMPQLWNQLSASPSYPYFADPGRIVI